MTIQMKATEQYSPTVLFIMLNKVVLTFESVNEILKCDHPKAAEQYFVWCYLFYNVFFLKAEEEVSSSSQKGVRQN